MAMSTVDCEPGRFCAAVSRWRCASQGTGSLLTNCTFRTPIMYCINSCAVSVFLYARQSGCSSFLARVGLLDQAQSMRGSPLIPTSPSGRMARKTGTIPPPHDVPGIAAPSKSQPSGIVYEYARMLNIGSVTDTVRVPPAGSGAAMTGGTVATTALAEGFPGREVFAAPAETKNVLPAISSATKILATFSDVRFKFIFPPTVSTHCLPATTRRIVFPLQIAQCLPAPKRAAYHLA